MTEKTFFDESKEQSEIKSVIVSKYFWAWAKVVIPSSKKHSNKIAYMDLFAGPGRYSDGTKSTPLLILEKAIKDPDMRNMLVTVFNDRDSIHVNSLKAAINTLPDIDNLKYKPQVNNAEVGEEIVKQFKKMRFIPTLFFVDPWGYKGLSLKLINAVLKDWGCDCIFFFNYNRINMGLTNPLVKEHMDSLFAQERADKLRMKLAPLNAEQRELTVIEELVDALKEMGGEYILPFRFRNESGKRTSHHLIFVSKAFKGYDIMKNIMAKESSAHKQGVPSFEYNPADEKYPMLFELTRPLDSLKEILVKEYAGQTLTVRAIYEKNSIGKSYIIKNYKDVIKEMEQCGLIVVDPPIEKRRKRKGKATMADNVKIIFPERSEK